MHRLERHGTYPVFMEFQAMAYVRNLLLALVLALGSAPAIAAATTGIADPPGPIEQLLPAPAIGHAFNAPAFQQIADDLAALGYQENEYIFSGHAGIYAYASNHLNASIQRVGTTTYVDRMLVRRPADPSRFSGNVLVEVINSALQFDGMVAWPYMQRRIVQAGDIWVGITSTPMGIRSLQLANPRRYASLGFGRNPNSRCHNQSAEVGVIFDILTQTGQLLRQPNHPLNPLKGLDIKALIATGYSQGAMILATYTHAIAPHVEDRVYDGYISAAGIGGYALNNCQSLGDLLTQVLAPVSNGTPLMQVQTTSETALLPLGLPGESLHDRSIGAPYRYYDLAGSGHLDGILLAHAPAASDLQAAGGYDLDQAIQGCHLAYPISQFPIGYVYDSLLANMEDWIRKGKAPPASRRFVLGGWLRPGHALGGVRSPAADIPIADYFIGIGPQLTTQQGGFDEGIPCAFAAIQNPYSHRQLQRMYGNHQHYLDRVSRRARQLQREGFLTVEDASEIIRQAAASHIP